MTLTEFLLARIEEDEAVARAVGVGLQQEHASEFRWETYPMPNAGPNRWTMTGVGVAGDEMGHRTETMFLADAAHMARHDPARVLAQCAAHREMVEVLTIADAMEKEPDRIGTADHLLRALATIWRSHPDYREEWT